MKTQKIKIALSLAALAICSSINAQDTNTDNHTIGITIPEVALVDIEPAASKNITMGFTAPTEAGLPIVPSGANNTLWLNYSSIKSATDATRNVSVQLNALIPGFDIRVLASTASGAGGGTLGTPSAQLTLSAAANQTIVSGIGSAYTGDGASNGHNLTYELAPGAGGTVASYADLEATTTAVATVTYTISDN